MVNIFPSHDIFNKIGCWNLNIKCYVYLLAATFHWSVPWPTDSTIRARDAASAIAASTPTITRLLLTISPLWNDLYKFKLHEVSKEQFLSSMRHLYCFSWIESDRHVIRPLLLIHITSHRILSHQIKSNPIPSHPISSHPIPSHPITSRHIISQDRTFFRTFFCHTCKAL